MAEQQRVQTHSKLVLLGDSGVGKSCLVLRFVRNEWLEDSETTIGAAFLTKTITLPDATCKLEVWDTAGQERYRSLAPMYYRGAQAAAICFALNNKSSFDAAKSWVKELQRRAAPDLVMALVGTKADLAASGQRAVDAEEAAEYAKSINAIYMETSAKDRTNVDEVFTAIAQRVPRKAPQPKQTVELKPAPTPTPKKANGCC